MNPQFMQHGADKLLACLGEETGELVKELGDQMAAIGKTQRWGAQSSNPLLPVTERETNLDWIKRSHGNVMREFTDYLIAYERYIAEVEKP